MRARATYQVPGEFWEMAERQGSCLVWRGPTHKGYGHLSYQGRRWWSHRLAWTLARGPIPHGLFVCHTCDNRTCVDPLHMFLGTLQDNTRDHVAKGRAHLNGRHGEGNSQHKLTAEQVREIRQRAMSGESHRALALAFGLVHQQVTRIVNRQRWANLP
jgi:hypothetical protein